MELEEMSGDACLFCNREHNFSISVNRYCIFCGKLNPNFDSDMFMEAFDESLEQCLAETCSNQHRDFLEGHKITSELLKVHILDTIEGVDGNSNRAEKINEHFMEGLPIANWKGELGKFCPYCGGDFESDLNQFLRPK